MIEERRYYIKTVDPLHIGTGGIHLGKVDNTITLDPVTLMPKIPGTALLGAIKYYTDLKLISLEEKNKNFQVGRAKNKDSKWCASTKGQCGDTCFMCYTFGYSKADGESSKGVLAFCDAELILFPVYSMTHGEVFITSVTIAKYFDENIGAIGEKEVKCMVNNDNSINQVIIGNIVFNKANGNMQPLMYTEVFKQIELEGSETRLMVVSDNKFRTLVQKNLEQRTSVAIDPETGAAKDGALFTFEAVPKNAVFRFQINMNDYKKEKSPFKNNSYVNELKDWAEDKNEFKPIDLISLSFNGLEKFGMGGMNTRGFGRIKIVKC